LDELCLEDKILRRRILSVFPNALTTMNAIMGLLAIFFAEQGRIKEAYLFIIGATIFDKLDGSMARKLGLTESLPDENRKFNITFGGLMDDFADSISFCIAPACIFYICLSQFANNLIPIIFLSSVSIIYALAGISRLIYFTFDTSPIPGFFKGMPTPAAALFVLAPLIIFSRFAVEGSALTNYAGYFCTGLMGVAAVLMNLYLVKYLHMGRYMDKHPLFARINLILILVFLFTPFFGYVVFIQILLYVFSPMITWRVDQPPQNNEGRLA
jgi:phosphatidylserine synthase